MEIKIKNTQDTISELKKNFKSLFDVKTFTRIIKLKHIEVTTLRVHE